MEFFHRNILNKKRLKYVTFLKLQTVENIQLELKFKQNFVKSDTKQTTQTNILKFPNKSHQNYRLCWHMVCLPSNFRQQCTKSFAMASDFLPVIFPCHLLCHSLPLRQCLVFQGLLYQHFCTDVTSCIRQETSNNNLKYKCIPHTTALE